MKSSVLILLFLLLSATGAAQGVCVSGMLFVPVVHNLKLQMSPEEAQAALGRKVKIKIKRAGERTFFQNFIEKPAPPPLSGIRALYLRFFDRKLYQIEIFYENRNVWKTLENFTNYLAADMNFPASSWQTAKGRSEIKCAEISIVADNVLNPRVEITDETTLAQIEVLRKKKDE